MCCIVASLTLTGACAPSGLPARWLDRELFESEQAYVYASNEDAAREAERLVRKVVEEYECAPGGEPPRGLVIVTDVNDALILADPRRLFELCCRAPGYEWSSDQALTERWELMQTSGVEPRDALGVKSCVLEKRDLLEALGLSRELIQRFGWAVTIPTEAVIARDTHKLVRSTVGTVLDAETVGAARPAAKLALIPLRYRARSMAEAERDVVLYAAMVTSRPSCDGEETWKSIQTYKRWRQSGPSWYRGSWGGCRGRK